MTTVRDALAAAWGIDWFQYQLDPLVAEEHTDPVELRACLYYRTGAGKTYTAIALLVEAGCTDAVVVAPPATHEQWQKHAAAAGLAIRTISHAKYRMKTTKFGRTIPFIVDEFHMLGGSTGAGWKKLRVQSRHMLAPLVILSATPNYNDAERVYCVEYVLKSMAGDYISWIYANCETEQNPFGIMPKVIGFMDGRPAKEHLAELPHVYYVEDPHEDFKIAEIVLDTQLPDEFEEYGMHRREKRMIASRMERESASRKLQLVEQDGRLRPEVYDVLTDIAGLSGTPIMVFCARATIARAGHAAAVAAGARSGLVTFQANRAKSLVTLAAFKAGELDILFGTATMSTGVDGLDRACDTLVLLDDTDDASLRRQIIGRILPRGTSSDVSKKIVVRLVLGT